MNLFELDPGIENIPELPLRDHLRSLFATHDIKGADYQFDNPRRWKNELIQGALNIVYGVTAYCQSIGDIQATEELAKTDWENRWLSNTGDIAADLNFIYSIATGDNTSAYAHSEDRDNFFMKIPERNETVEALFDFPKEILPPETISEHVALAELNKALWQAFASDSGHGHYAPQNLKKLHEKPQ